MGRFLMGEWGIINKVGKMGMGLGTGKYRFQGKIFSPGFQRDIKSDGKDLSD
jgi:hypothetical protein